MKCKEDWISNIPRGWGFVEERLDRVVATDTWRALHREAEICNLEVVHSDHSALLLNTTSQKYNKHPR